ncbi:nitroreductase/quinone reductase family protein [Mycobacterium sp. URHB0044]|uniref:nitroreductase/quinone reductase family protein n=1 Tax=Mycobacterium sp. URHB0044 TaxID=1380386 RepID=UPI00048EABFB|nr:nitroreductase/quinone reductase family protein [Mycobacterium sp. URHB0044]
MPPTSIQRKRRIDWIRRHVLNPITVRLPTQVVLETTGRKSGLPRRTPVGGKVVDRQFWMVAGDGESAYVRNIKANEAIRVRIRGRWHGGTAVLLPDDDTVSRLKQLPRMNSSIVRAMGIKPLTIRVDLD